MAKRNVHLRPATAVWIGQTKTHCGRTLYNPTTPMEAAVVTFSGVGGDTDATVHGTLVTCKRCLHV